MTLCLNAHACDRLPAFVGYAHSPSILAWKITMRIPHHLANEVDGFDPCGVVVAKVSFGWEFVAVDDERVARHSRASARSRVICRSHKLTRRANRSPRRCTIG